MEAGEAPVDPEHDPVLTPPWNHRGTVAAAVALSGGDERVERRVFLCLGGPALTAPAHQWLVHEPGPLVSGLSGRRVSAGMVHRFTGMIAELRRMEDVAGSGSVFALAHQEFGWVAGLLDQASHDERTGRALHVVLAELGQFCGWSAYEAGHHGLGQRFCIAAFNHHDRPYTEIMEKSPFSVVEEFRVPVQRRWSTESILGYLYSTSFAAPHLFGERLGRFERQITTVLGGFSDNDTFSEGNEFLIHIGRRSEHDRA